MGNFNLSIPISLQKIKKKKNNLLNPATDLCFILLSPAGPLLVLWFLCTGTPVSLWMVMGKFLLQICESSFSLEIWLNNHLPLRQTSLGQQVLCVHLIESQLKGLYKGIRMS